MRSALPPASHAWIRPIPNALTALRLLLAFVLPFAPLGLRLVIVAVAALTDLLDGWIARRFQVTSEAGRLLDGVADKAFALAAVATLVSDGHVRLWQGLLVLARDLVVAAMALLLLLRHRGTGFQRMQVRLAGKLTTLLVFAWLLALLLEAPAPLTTSLFVLAAASSLGAAGDYLGQYLRARRDPPRGT